MEKEKGLTIGSQHSTTLHPFFSPQLGGVGVQRFGFHRREGSVLRVILAARASADTSAPTQYG